MLHLLTGKKGSGKGLFLLSTVEQRRIKENRKVYYHGIPGLKLDWIEFQDPKEWYKLPPNSIIVMDEADLYFPVRPNSSAVPEYISMFKFDRKTGLDIYVATQDPTFIDAFVRKSSDIHYHLMRVFGKEKSVIHKFTTVRDDVAKNRKDSITTDFAFPKQYYGSYESAEIHNIPDHAPFRYYLKFILPVVVIALCYFAYHQFSAAINSGEKQTIEKKEMLSNEMDPHPGQRGDIKKLQVEDLTYIQAHAPEIQDFPHTAPIYKKVVDPVHAPYPAACIESKSQGCKCFTQQGTSMTVSDDTCRQIVKTGFFIEWEQSDPQVQAVNRSNGVSGRSPDVDQQLMQIDDVPSRASPSSA